MCNTHTSGMHKWTMSINQQEIQLTFKIHIMITNAIQLYTRWQITTFSKTVSSLSRALLPHQPKFSVPHWGQRAFLPNKYKERKGKTGHGARLTRTAYATESGSPGLQGDPFCSCALPLDTRAPAYAAIHEGSVRE